MRRPIHQDPTPGRRVALITLCVPSHETIDVIADQLRALTHVRYPHDSWVLDEGADPAIEALAAELGVHYFTRKGKPLWNQPGPPFQSRTKSGNVNAWLDSHGAEYSHFTQLDIDHHPVPDYLERVLGLLPQPESGVGAGPERLREPRALAGPRVLGAGVRPAGSPPDGVLRFLPDAVHHRQPLHVRHVRCAEIGGFQPTRAEDHLNTVRLAAMGYQGVFLPEVIAVGDGPESFDAYLGQQFAWAYSMIQVLSTRPADPSLHARAGGPVPLRAELVHALVAVGGGPVGPPHGRAALGPPDRRRPAVAVPRLQRRAWSCARASCGGGAAAGSSRPGSA